MEEPGGDRYIEVHNEELVAKALGDDVEHFKMDTFHEICKELGTGALLSVEAGEDGPDVYLDIVAQDGTPYRYFYFGSGGLQGVKNLETGEWPYASVE